MTRGRGGSRSGAGAPRGNRNAVKHGRYGTDPDLRHLLATFTAEQRFALMPYIRAASGSIKRQRASGNPPDRYAHTNVVPFRPTQPSATTTTHPEQSNGEPGALRVLALRLASHGFVGADGFVRGHSPAAPVIESVADHLDAMDDDTYRALRNPGGLIRAAVHEEIADRGGAVDRCPWCSWRGQERGERTS